MAISRGKKKEASIMDQIKIIDHLVAQLPLVVELSEKEFAEYQDSTGVDLEVDGRIVIPREEK